MLRFAPGVAAILTVLVIASGRPASAQTLSERRAAVGLARQGGLFGDDSPKSTLNVTPILGFEMRRHPDHLVGAAFEAAIPLRMLQNPHIDERIRGLFVLAGPEIGRRVFGRIMAGGVLGFATGRDSELVIGPAVGFAAGWHFKVGQRASLTPEMVGRAGGAVGAAVWMLGAQLAIGVAR